MLREAFDFLARRATAYRRTFLNIDGKVGPVAEVVLADLARFCRANTSTFHPDPRVAANLDGRREVWLRIQQHLNLTEQQLWDIYGGKNNG